MNALTTLNDYMDRSIKVSRVIGLALLFGAASLLHGGEPAEGCPLIKLLSLDESRQVYLEDADGSRLLIYDPEFGEEQIIPRSNDMHIMMNLDIDLREVNAATPAQDTILLNSEQVIRGILLDYNSEWVSYSLPDSGAARRHVLRQTDVAQITLANGAVIIPPIAGSTDAML